ncbi:VOC family protein [Lacinutrix iliipiscaria]|uniref:VOC family protein n=1 Tax=Lacinutrix iliipiscaria TaxID=1230532 RepID=A0ABW5WRK5_9FLAO
MNLNPYLAFNGNCEEAIRFYEDVLGGEITMMMRYGEAPPEYFPVSDDMKNLVMHCTLEFNGCTFFASDNMESNAGNNFSMSIDADEEEQAVKIFESLLEGGQAIMPFDNVFWGGKFGMLVDKFGVQWMVSVGH